MGYTGAMTRGWRGTLGILLLVLVPVAIVNAAAARSSSEEPDAAGGRRLKLLSWNVNGAIFTADSVEKRLTAIAGEILRRQPDLVLLQEVVRPVHAALLDRELTEYDRVDSVPTKRFFFWRIREGGLVSYLRRGGTWKLTGGGFRQFKSRPDWWKLWERDAFDDKGIEILELGNRRTGQALIVLNTHLQAYGSKYDDIRRDQAEEVFRFGSRFELPVVAAGDFNMPPSVIAPLMPPRWADLTGRKRAACECGTFRETGRWVDYVFACSTGGAPPSVEIELIRGGDAHGPWSDHSGIQAEIKLEGRDAERSNNFFTGSWR